MLFWMKSNIGCETLINLVHEYPVDIFISVNKWSECGAYD